MVCLNLETLINDYGRWVFAEDNTNTESADEKIKDMMDQFEADHESACIKGIL